MPMMLSPGGCCCAEPCETLRFWWRDDATGEELPVEGGVTQFMGQPFATLRIPDATPDGYWRLEMFVNASDLNFMPDEQAAYSIEFGGYTFRAQAGNNFIQLSVTDSNGDQLTEICPIQWIPFPNGSHNVQIVGTLYIHKYESGTSVEMRLNNDPIPYVWTGLTLNADTDLVFNPESSQAPIPPEYVNASENTYIFREVVRESQPSPNACFVEPTLVATEPCCPTTLEERYSTDEFTIDLSAANLPVHYESIRLDAPIPVQLALGNPNPLLTPTQVTHDDGNVFYWAAYGERQASTAVVDCNGVETNLDGSPFNLLPAIGKIKVILYQIQNLGFGGFSQFLHAEVCLQATGNSPGDSTVSMLISGDCQNRHLQTLGNPPLDLGTGSGNAGEASTFDVFSV